MFIDLVAVLDGAAFVLADDEGVLTCVDRRGGKWLWQRRLGNAVSWAIAPLTDTGGLVAAVDGNGVLTLLDSATGRTIASGKAPGCPGGATHAHAVASSSDRRHLLVVCRELTAPELVAVTDAAAAHGLTVRVHPERSRGLLLDDQLREVGRIDVSVPFAVGRSTRVVSLRSGRHWVRIEDALSCAVLLTCEHCYERGGYAVSISPDERLVAWSGYEKYGHWDEPEFIRLVDLSVLDDSGRDVLWGTSEFTHLVFSHDGTHLLIGDSDGAVMTLRLVDGEVQLLGRVMDTVQALVQAGNDAVLALGDTGEVCCWPLRT